MYSLFGRKPKAVPMQETIAANIAVIEMNEKIVMKMEKDAAAERARAKAKCKTNRKAALTHLARAKKFDTRAESCRAGCDRLLELNDALMDTLGNTQTVQALQSGVSALKAAQGSMTLDAVDDLRMELDENAENAAAISSLLSGGQPDLADDDDLNDEFDAMMEDEAFLEMEAAFLRTPDIPVGIPTRAHVPSPILPQETPVPLSAVPTATNRNVGGGSIVSPVTVAPALPTDPYEAERRELAELEASMM
jgi:hypothetical protein